MSPRAPGSFALHRKAKRLVVDAVLEPAISLRRLESWFVFWGRVVYRIRKPTVIGVTGSVGKSTTTAMIATVLEHPDAARVVGPSARTIDNMNDDVGVAATLLRFGDAELPWPYHRRLALFARVALRAIRLLVARYPKVMVLEIGVGATADFGRIVSIARPDVAVVTRIGAAHLEKLGSVEGVVEEKGTLVRAVPAGGLIVLGQEHDYVRHFEQMARTRVVKVPGRGIEMSRNVAREVCRHLGIPQETTESALRDFKSPEGRLNRLEFSAMTIIDDTYNANPLSMQLGLDTLAQSASPGRRRVAILGHMSELGDEAARHHQEVGAYARTRADVVIGVGDLSRHYAPDRWFATSDECASHIANVLRFGDCLLVKGSASARMQPIVSRLRAVADQLKDDAIRID